MYRSIWGKNTNFTPITTCVGNTDGGVWGACFCGFILLAILDLSTDLGPIQVNFNALFVFVTLGNLVIDTKIITLTAEVEGKD